MALHYNPGRLARCELMQTRNVGTDIRNLLDGCAGVNDAIRKIVFGEAIVSAVVEGRKADVCPCVAIAHVGNERILVEISKLAVNMKDKQIRVHSIVDSVQGHAIVRHDALKN
jgi:hypothetical protein